MSEQLICSVCGSSGFKKSRTGTGCEFCDGTEGGNAPCVICGEPATDEWEGEPCCYRVQCQYQIQQAADYHAEAGDR